MIVLTNTRTLLRSDWIDAPDGVRYAVYAVIYAGLGGRRWPTRSGPTAPSAGRSSPPTAG